MQYGYPTQTGCFEDFMSLCAVHHQFLLRVVGLRKTEATGYMTFSYREVLKMINKMVNRVRIDMTIRTRQLCFAGGLVR